MHMAQLRFLLLIPLLPVLSGCAQNSPSHTAFQETPPSILNIDTPLVEQTALLSPKPEKTSQKQSISFEPDNIWSRLLSLYQLPEIEHERIDQQLNWYLKHPRFLTKIQQRAVPYLHFILDEIEAKNIPGELALLPAIESAFSPEAYSSSRAAGLWQFIPSTGRYFGLKQNWWYDGRKDVIASTQAATLYLKQLSQEFNGDWLLALASYNAGKGNIRKAIRKNQKKDLPADYWSLKLKQETMDYVPRLLAIAKIFANPEKYNVTLLDIPDQPHFEVVDIESQLDLSKAAELAQTPIEEFLKLNPAFHRWSTAPDGPHKLLIPAQRADLFKEKLASLSDQDRMKWIRHKVKPGESLSLIAKKHNTSIRSIKESNHLKSSRIKAGQRLLIPVSHKARKLPALARNKRLRKRIYTVKKGDSFWRIARKYSVTSKQLVRWNRLSTKSPLRPGQRLIIKTGT